MLLLVVHLLFSTVQFMYKYVITFSYKNHDFRFRAVILEKSYISKHVSLDYLLGELRQQWSVTGSTVTSTVHIHSENVGEIYIVHV